MEETSETGILYCIENHRKFFGTQKTKDVVFRIDSLKRFKTNILKFEKQITDALWKDLHKSYEEAYLTEISIVLSEIDFHIRKLRFWAKPQHIRTPLHLLPSRSRVIYEPLGVALIIAPWNYPFQLLMNSLIGAISAGCCAILKPSPYTSNTALVMEMLVAETFKPEHVSIVLGGRQVNEVLLKQRFDVIFFTGSPAVGKVVMKAAAEHLTPVILELGGKSPCIVDADANISIAARRIAWGKTINAGQTCIAPDYLFVHQSVKDELLKKIADNFVQMFGNDCQESRFFPRIVNDQAFDRLTTYLDHGRIVTGGKTDRSERYISPTIIDDVNPESAMMQEEIFGPILPVMTFKHIDEAISYVNMREKPLAFYYFGHSGKAREVLLRTTSGGGCINDTLMHITNHNMPFGGVGNSGIGKYHGRDSFLAFSNVRSVIFTPTWIDLPLKYVPFRFFKLIRKIV